MSCDVGKAAEGLENEAEPYIASPTSQLIVQPFRCFTYITAHSTALPLLHIHHRHFTYVTWWAAHAPMMMFNISMMILLSAMTAARRIIWKMWNGPRTQKVEDPWPRPIHRRGKQSSKWSLTCNAKRRGAPPCWKTSVKNLGTGIILQPITAMDLLLHCECHFNYNYVNNND